MRTRNAALALALLAGCSHAHHSTQPAPWQSTGLPTATPTPTPSPTPVQLLSPFTGLPVGQLRPILAIKVDNAPLARPQWGLDHADLVYEEVVEGRTTRFLAIYSSQDAPDIGPVRSVRESDMPLLREYGRIAFAFSGGNSGVFAIFRASGLLNASRDAMPGAYQTRGRRRDAFNFVTSTGGLGPVMRQGTSAHDIGLRFGPLRPMPGMVPVRTLSVTWSGFARTGWIWAPQIHRFVRSMDGRPSMLRDGSRMGAANVIVQYVPVRLSHFSDVHGAPSPYTTTTGVGQGYVLRDGRAVPVTWRRPGFGATHYYDKLGRDVQLRPGPVWVMLVPNDLRAVLR